MKPSELSIQVAAATGAPEEYDIEHGRSKFQMAETLEDGQSSVISQLAHSIDEQQQHQRQYQSPDNHNNDRNDDGAEGIVRAEASTLRNLRIAMICLVVSAAAFCGYLIYKISLKNETDSFKQSFVEAATKLTKAFSDTHAETLNYAYVMSVALSSGLYVDSHYTPSFPNVSIQHLDVLSRGLANRLLIDDLIWSPFLQTADERSSWEEYALDNLANVSVSAYPPCFVCGEGNEILNPNALVLIPGFRQITCEGMDQFILAGNISPQQCSLVTEFAKPTCGCQKVVNEDKNGTVSSLYSTQKGIFDLQVGDPAIEKGPPPYLPVWQITPTADSKQVAMFNQLSEPWRKDAFDDMLKWQIPIFSRTFDPTQDGIYKLNNIPSSGVVASIFYPVFKTLTSDEIAGSLVLDFSWLNFFNYILPPQSNGVVIVLENTLNQTFTYQIDGSSVSFVGVGDLHDDRYNSDLVNSSYVDFDSLLFFSAPNSRSNDSNAYETSSPSCLYRVRIYSSQTFESQHMTSKPAIYTVIVVLAFAATSLVFLAYDWIVRRLQNKVLDSAKRSEAIVSSLFPAMVRDRIFGSSTKALTTSGFGLWFGKREVNLENPLVNHKARLRSYLSHPTSFDMLSQSDPIADLYPNTTVMFADIAGFTAWSSEREPSQVFKLLESLFGEFDEVARELGVFKVETIGDCYVAVTGLPENRKDHAVVMVEFAFKCLVRMRELVSKLELALGPGTTDLSVRVGLHSGPVTAGVLRGDRARFQLFGDTLNVAARIKSTSEPNMVHVSKETANLLTEAGKEYWLNQRQELVSVKGKGDMQSYWAKPLPFSGPTSAEETGGVTADGGECSGRSQARPVSLDGMETDLWGGTSLDNSVVIRSSSSQGRERLVDWFADLLHGLLQKIAIKNIPSGKSRSTNKGLPTKHLNDSGNLQFVDEITEVIDMPEFNERITNDQSLIEMGHVVRSQLRDYVSNIASLYRDNAFHNFEHACHVAMSSSKLIKRIIAPENVVYKAKYGNKMKSHKVVSKEVHESTFGISSDPLMQFAVLFSALIHDVDHTGLTNQQLVKEGDPLAAKYCGKCVAEQRSIQVAWDSLMETRFDEFRRCIFQSDSEKQRFRQLLVNAVIATDIADRELSTWRKNRWDKVFHQESGVTDKETISARKATIVFEYIIQASDVAHTMQHWHVYQKWNKRLFDERYAAYLAGRDSEDPSIGWHNGEIWFFDNYIIPLAKKLEECNVFGVSCDEFLMYALQNRHEWELKGETIVSEMVAEQNYIKDVEGSGEGLEHELMITEEHASYLRHFLGEGDLVSVIESTYDLAKSDDPEILLKNAMDYQAHL
jgi:class 3 adenylate cyclase